jgi:hypothetical protein
VRIDTELGEFGKGPNLQCEIPLILFKVSQVIIHRLDASKRPFRSHSSLGIVFANDDDSDYCTRGFGIDLGSVLIARGVF